MITSLPPASAISVGDGESGSAPSTLSQPVAVRHELVLLTTDDDFGQMASLIPLSLWSHR